MPGGEKGETVAELQPIPRVNVFQTAFDQLSAWLDSEAIAPGERLPSERELAAQLQVSRPLLREVVRALRAVGMVEARGRARATYIKSTAPARVGHGPPLALPLAEAELLELEEFREAIETQIAALAAERACPEDLEAGERALAAMRREIAGNVEAFLEADDQFHLALGAAAGNRLLQAAQRQVHDRERDEPNLRRAGMQTTEVKGALRQTVEAHQHILEAVRQRDAARARRLMREHISQTRQHVIVAAILHQDGRDGEGQAAAK